VKFVSKVLYGISPIGLGHATRSLVVANHLRKAGVEVRLYSGGKAAEFIRGECDVDAIVTDPVPNVARGEMKRASLWYARSWVALRRTMGRTRALFDSFHPDLVVCDEEFSGLLLAEQRKVRRILISDELELGFAKTWLARKLEERVERWYSKLQNSVDVLLIPEPGSDVGNRRYVGPIAREVTKSRAQTIQEFGLPGTGSLVLLSLSGSGIGDFLLDRTVQAMREVAKSGTTLAIAGNRGTKVTADGVVDLGLVRENQNLIAAVDLVISTAGKSTIDEAAACGTPLIAIPIKNHAEQERNAAAIGYSTGDLERLGDLIREMIGSREPPKVFPGGEQASRLILSML
jgi:UDP-N-acetylglucosamine--N-acetylmuramyl-(pentapeptide) pyrophosphoryl-undecaprenol N-acetylglucosamine transferase